MLSEKLYIQNKLDEEIDNNSNNSNNNNNYKRESRKYVKTCRTSYDHKQTITTQKNLSGYSHVSKIMDNLPEEQINKQLNKIQICLNYNNKIHGDNVSEKANIRDDWTAAENLQTDDQIHRPYPHLK